MEQTVPDLSSSEPRQFSLSAGIAPAAAARERTHLYREAREVKFLSEAERKQAIGPEGDKVA